MNIKGLEMKNYQSDTFEFYNTTELKKIFSKALSIQFDLIYFLINRLLLSKN